MTAHASFRRSRRWPGLAEDLRPPVRRAGDGAVYPGVGLGIGGEDENTQPGHRLRRRRLRWPRLQAVPARSTGTRTLLVSAPLSRGGVVYEQGKREQKR